MRFNKVLIVGAGLIGGSIGLALKKKGIAKEIIAVGRRKSSIRKAMKLGAIDRGGLCIEDCVKDAEFVVISTPACLVPGYTAKVLSLNPDCIITDVASTKSDILRDISKLRGKERFIGSHPMAGSEKSGVEFARDNIFQDSVCVITPVKWTNNRFLKIVSGFWESIGCRVRLIGPSEHDRLVSMFSHLPHIVACCLISSVKEKDSWISSTGFRNATRLASADSVMWRDICITNKREILNSLEKFKKHLQKIKYIIEKDKWDSLHKFFEDVKNKRERIV